MLFAGLLVLQVLRGCDKASLTMEGMLLGTDPYGCVFTQVRAAPAFGECLE